MNDGTNFRMIDRHGIDPHGIDLRMIALHVVDLAVDRADRGLQRSAKTQRAQRLQGVH